MRTYKQHKEIVKDAMNSVLANNDALIERNTNVCMQTIAGSFPIGATMAEMDVTAGTAAWLPENLAGIVDVRDSEDRQVFERGASTQDTDEELYRYFVENVKATPASDGLPFASTGSITSDTNALTAGHDAEAAGVLSGMTVRIVNATHGEYYYKISSVDGTDIVIEGAHPYTESGVEITVLRADSRRIRFVDPDEELLSSGTFTVYYWTYPNPLSQDTDIIPLAYPDALEVMTIRRIPDTKNRRPVSKTEIDDSLALAQRREPVQRRPFRPVGQQGRPFVMATPDSEAYNERGR